MKKKIEYEVSYEVVCTIEYLGEEQPGQHYFKLRKEQPEGLWDTGEDEAIAHVWNGQVFDIEGYSCIVREEEADAIKEMMAGILAQ